MLKILLPLLLSFLVSASAWGGLALVTDDSLSGGNNFDFSGNSTVTICALVNWDGGNGTARKVIVNKGTWDAGNAQYMLSLSSAENIVFECAVDGTSGSQYRSATSSQTLSNNTWYHVCGVINPGANVKVYVDGVETAGTASPTLENTNATTLPFEVGRFNSSVGQYFSGKINELSVWNGALTAAEIESLSKSKVKSMSLQFSPSTLNGLFLLDQCIGGSGSDAVVFKNAYGTVNLTGNDGANNTGLTCISEEVLSYP